MTKLYYSIKDVAKLIEEPESTLRYWEDMFPDVINPSRKDKLSGTIKPLNRKDKNLSPKDFGIRFYSEKDVEKLRLIRYLIRDCSLKHDGVRIRLENNIENAEKQAKIFYQLKNVRAGLLALCEAFDEVEKQIS